MTYKREDILARVKENRDKHENNLELAMKAYTLEVLEQLEKLYTEIHVQFESVKNDGISALKQGSFYVTADKPEDHRKDYDQVIDMLEMSNLSELELDRAEFTQYVRDEWKWSAKFAATTNDLISKYNLS